MISVIIPTYNAESTIERCLDSLFSQKYDGDFEVIVVNDGSTDRTKEIVSKYKKIKLINIKNSGPAKARNIGLKSSKGELLLFIDSDCKAEENWMGTLAKSLKKYEVVTGKVVAEYQPPSFTSKFMRDDFNYRHQIKKGHTNFTFFANFGLRKKVLDQYGFFDENRRITEDNEFSYRLSENIIFYDPEAIVIHTKICTMSSFAEESMKTGFYYGSLFPRYHEKIKNDDHLSKRILLQPFLSFLILFWMIPAISLTALSLIILTNLRFLSFIREKEKSISLTISSFFMTVLRGFLWLLGGLFGFIKGSFDLLF